MANSAAEKAALWLTDTFDAETQQEVTQLIKNDPEGLDDAFYKSLSFGTGGMRGLMGVGDNRINKYTLGKNTQGLANYLKKVFTKQTIKVAIAYDCRHNSRTLANTVANVFAANGIVVYLFSDLRPTPLLSFTVRHLNCHCGIVLTASHNPPAYNGYKVYWQDGGQLVPPQDHEIISEINSITYKDIRFNSDPKNIIHIDSELDRAFLEEAQAQMPFEVESVAKENLRIVFTSLHGTSITLVPELLKQSGFSNVLVVEDQATPDGDFPTVKSPNPEEPEALSLALEKAEAYNADIVIGTDPDSDRLGIAVRNSKGKLQLLNGNQSMALKTYFLLETLQTQKALNPNHFIASTVVSTPLMAKIASHFNVRYKETLTGFKWIAKLVKDFPEDQLICGGEESFGFMLGDFVRDKDAVTATLLSCMIAAHLKQNNQTFYSYLNTIYNTLGLRYETLKSLVKEGKKGAEDIAAKMHQLRHTPPSTLGGSPVVKIEDYLTQHATCLTNKKTEPITLPKTNLLIFYTENHAKIAVRPSGTEPKIKFYVSTFNPRNTPDTKNTLKLQAQAILDNLL